jgi:hypothetical protein
MTRATLIAAAGLAACTSASTPNLPTTIPLDAGLFTHRRTTDAGGQLDAGDLYGSISGQVTLFGADSSFGVQISISPGGLSTVSTDDSGDFFLDPIAPGPFTLTFSAPGYATATLQGVLGPGDAAEETVQLQRSVGLLLLDGGADGGAPLGVTLLVSSPEVVYAATDRTLYALDMMGATSRAIYVDPVGLRPVGVSSGGMAFLLAGLEDDGGLAKGGNLSVLVAWDGGAELVDVSGALAESAVIAGDRLFLARPQDAGGEPPWLMAWSSVGNGPPWLQTELDDVLYLPAPVVFGTRLAGYRQQAQTSFQLMGFGNGSFEPIADAIPFWPQVLDSSADRKLVTVIAADGGDFDAALLAVSVLDGGTTAVSGPGLAVNCTFAIPTSPDELLFANTWGQFVVIDAPDNYVYFSYPLASAARPGGAFLTESPGDGGVATVLVTDNGDIADGGVTLLPFGELWSTPVFSPDGAFAVFTHVPVLYDLVDATEYTLASNLAFATFDAQGDQLMIIGDDGTLSLVALNDSLPSAQAGSLPSNTQPLGTILEGTAVTAAAFTSDGSGVIYAGTDPHGDTGIFFLPQR